MTLKSGGGQSSRWDIRARFGVREACAYWTGFRSDRRSVLEGVEFEYLSGWIGSLRPPVIATGTMGRIDQANGCVVVATAVVVA
ncbi:hypothetical protein BJI47_07720 [Rhodococcus sp. 1168]|nr:hypothetical protein BJI47_07720 [Rhodococcus sp. 1168]